MLRRSVLTGAVGLVGLPAVRPARADTLDEVKKRGTLMIGTEAAYVPYEFFKDGKIIGYDPDIADLMVPKIGAKAEFIDTQWSGIIPALYAKKFDCIISAMTITKERAEKVLFSMPYADASNVILLRADDDRIKTADDLSGKIIGVQLGSAAAGIIKVFEAKLKAAGKPGFADVKQYEHYPEAYQDLLNKRTDAVVNSRSTMMVVMRDAPGKFKMIGGVSDITAYYGMAFRKEDTALRDFVNDRLATMKKDGRLAKLQEKWFGGPMATPERGARSLALRGKFRLGAVWYAIPYMLQGAVVTLEISVCAMVLACVVGLVMGLISASNMRVPKAIIRAYVYFVRGTPALVQIFLVYFALPRIGFELSSFWSGVVALAFNSAGFIAEIMRAGLQSIDAGQTEAAISIGMTDRQSILFILLPQSLRRVTPPLTNELITLVKSSSLLSVISITELTRSAQLIIAEQFVPFELYARAGGLLPGDHLDPVLGIRSVEKRLA